ncbi:MAG TPA: endo-1,4-beta-xylanase, partial [Paludibacter sp.]
MRIKLLVFISFFLAEVQAQSKTEYLKQFTGFPLGASVDGEVLLKNKIYRDLVANEFNSLTTENHLKMYRVHPEQNKYDFAMGDSIVAFALRNKMRVHGHTLVWFDGMADWVKNFQGTKQDWENLIKSHIQTVVGHYKGKIASWDVVNEYLTQDHDSVRKFIVQEKLGDDYM